LATDVRVEAVLLGVRAGEDDDGGGGHVGRHGGEEEGRTRRRRSTARWDALSQLWSSHLKLDLVVKAPPIVKRNCKCHPVSIFLNYLTNPYIDKDALSQKWSRHLKMA
jgi:hypothetical protein